MTLAIASCDHRTQPVLCPSVAHRLKNLRTASSMRSLGRCGRRFSTKYQSSGRASSRSDHLRDGSRYGDLSALEAWRSRPLVWRPKMMSGTLGSSALGRYPASSRPMQRRPQSHGPRDAGRLVDQCLQFFGGYVLCANTDLPAVCRCAVLASMRTSEIMRELISRSL